MGQKLKNFIYLLFFCIWPKGGWCWVEEENQDE